MKQYFLNLFARAYTKKRFLKVVVVPFVLAFLCTFYILSGVMVAAMGSRPITVNDPSLLQNGIAEKILRLHVIANSDSKEDQEVKLKVKDGIVDFMQNFLSSTTSKEDAMEIINDHMQAIQQEATRLLRSYGYSYNVEVSLGRTMFPIKVYGDITLPAGEYDALLIKLGESSGQNWWCILFPNLCYVDATYQIVPDDSKEQLKSLLTEEEFDSIFEDKEVKIVVKSKFIEWLTHLFQEFSCKCRHRLL